MNTLSTTEVGSPAIPAQTDGIDDTPISAPTGTLDDTAIPAPADTIDDTAPVMHMLEDHVPLSLLADLTDPQGPRSEEILQQEGQPEVAWWESA
jgi:hypothetical protein